MSESFESSEENPKPEKIVTFNIKEMLDQLKADPEAQKQVFGKELSAKEFDKRFKKGVTAKDLNEIAEAIGLKPASLEDLGVEAPEWAKTIKKEEPGKLLAEKLMKEISEIQQGRDLEKLSKEDLRKIRDKYVEIKKALGLEQEATETTPEKAREIMKERFYGAEEIKDTFDIEVAKSEIPPIPYSPEQLKQARALGEMLILRISHDRKNPMTMKKINEIMQAKMEGDDKFLYNTDWYQNEEFYKQDSLKTEWKLVGGSFVPDISSKKDEEGKYEKDSTGNNYIHQTRLLRNYLKSLGSLTKAEEAECSDEALRQLSEEMGVDWDSQKITDNEKYNANWRKAACKLAELQINKNHRRKPAEIMYDFALQFKKTGDRGFLKGNYDWSPVLSSVGYLVSVGFAAESGAYVRSFRPDDRYDSLGVVSLR